MADVLNEPKQCTLYRVFMGELIKLPELYGNKKEHLNMHLDLLDNVKETLEGNHPLQELTSKLMETKSKTHSHHMSVLCKSQFGNKVAKQLANE